MTNLATPGPNSEPILAGGVAWTRGGVAYRSVARCRLSAASRLVNDPGLAQERLYPQPAFICSTLPEDWARRISRALWLRPRRPHAVRPRTVRTIQIIKQAPMNPAIR
jgi:hypothetical protein